MPLSLLAEYLRLKPSSIPSPLQISVITTLGPPRLPYQNQAKLNQEGFYMQIFNVKYCIFINNFFFTIIYSSFYYILIMKVFRVILNSLKDTLPLF